MTWLLMVAICVALAARRLRLPYTVGLVLTGVGLAFTSIGAALHLTHDFIFYVIIPPLLFQAAINLHWPALRRNLVPILTLALPGTLAAAAVTSGGLHLLLRWPWPPALLFGSLIAATDPVAVIAMFKDNRIGGRLRLLVEAESLFNDGMAAVLFTVISAWIFAPAPPGAVNILREFLVEIGGGLAAGLAVGGGVLFAARRSTDHLIEATLTTLGAYGAFLVAQSFGGSGVLATVMAGLVVGNIGILRETPVSLSGGEFITGLWEFIAFIANSLVFLGIGLAAAHLHFAALDLGDAAVTIVLVLAGRAVTVYPICLGLSRTRWRMRPVTQHALWLGGLRGALGLALALSLPKTLRWHDEILTATLVAVTFSIVVQGTGMKFLLKRVSDARGTSRPG